ncbi:uncharacterized protein A4U43_C05F25390 [Asparagus officinalis]|uniref:Uncharacterized protein n=1 Tax=Asparagus officinalis TaxID=4686 RepID=A0A5P1EZS2_ASPOF|nr:uncharacterized protein A4U43_C05F25390 [Asparagus officinalis]
MRRATAPWKMAVMAVAAMWAAWAWDDEGLDLEGRGREVAELEEGQGVESVVLVGDREAVEGAGGDNLIDDGEPLAVVEGCELVAEVRGISSNIPQKCRPPTVPLPPPATRQTPNRSNGKNPPYNPSLKLSVPCPNTSPPRQTPPSPSCTTPNSGAGDDNLCRWLYDTFQTTDSSLQLVVLRFLPIVAGLYLSRCTTHRHHQPLAGFEAVLLALYAHETVTREGNPMVANLPNLSAPSPYHEAKATSLKSNKNTEEPIATTAVISAVLEPHGTVRSTKRARIVSVALELYHTKISHMPVESKIEFCHFASSWAGNFTISEKKKNEDCEGKGERIPIPWELFLPTMRIVGHCLLGQTGGGELLNVAAAAAAKGLYERAMHDMNAPAVLAARSLMRLGMMGPDTILEPKMASVYTDASDSASDSTQIVAA